MTIRKTIQWMLVIVVLLASAGGAFAYWVWQRSDELLREQVLVKIREIAPHWEVEIGRARFDLVRKIHLHDVSLSSRNANEPTLRVEEVVVAFDYDELTKNQNVVLQKVRLIHPIISVTRSASGRWSWEDLLPVPESQDLTPEWDIEQLQVAVVFEHPDGGESTEIGVHDGAIALVPLGKRQYQIKGNAQVSSVGAVEIDGNVHVDEKSWSITGGVHDLVISDELFQVAEGISDRVGEARTQLEESLNKLVPAKRTTEINTGTASTGFGGIDLAGRVDVDFELTQWKPDTELDYQVRVQLQKGEVSHPALPFPLRELKGVFFVNNSEFIFRDVTCRNAAMQILVGGKFLRKQKDDPLSLAFDVRDVTLDHRLKERLPAGWRKIFDMIHPTGQVDVQSKLFYDGHGKWRPEGLVLTAKDCSIAYEKFQYRVTEIGGTLKQTPDGTGLSLDFLGRAGRQPVIARGAIWHPGPEMQLDLDVRVDGLLVNDSFVDVCPPKVQKTFHDLKLKGNANVLVHLHRPSGLAQPIRWDVSAEVFGASLEYVLFPYRLSDLRGRVDFRSIEGIWRFKDAVAVHGTGRVEAKSGEFRMPEAAGSEGLDLVVKAYDIELDKDLEQALPPKIQKVWKDVAPTGIAKTADVNVAWTPGHPPEITIPDVELVQGSLLLKAFPYSLEEVTGHVSYGRDPGDERHPPEPNKDRIVLKSITAKHDEMQLRTEGHILISRNDDAGAEWSVRLEDLQVLDLLPDRVFRRALPVDLRSVVDVLNPIGKMSFAGMMEFRGTPFEGDPVTSAWDLTSVLTQANLTAGVELKNVNGDVRTRGTWDGKKIDMQGTIDLDSLEVWGHQFTRVQGPFAMKDRYLIVGSPKAFAPGGDKLPSSQIDDVEHISARGFEGTFTLDAEALLHAETTTQYHVRVSMRDGNLHKYAERYLPGVPNMAGTMHGWVDLAGDGPDASSVKGKGQLLIDKAQMYQLPVMIQMFNALQKSMTLTAPDRAAFVYALASFSIGNSQFQFNEIDLIGNTIAMRGRGQAGFDGKLNLDFYSTTPKNQWNIPIFKQLVVDPLTNNWVKVEVRGHVQNPAAKTTVGAQFDAAVKSFLGAFNPNRTTPRLVIPWFTAPPPTALQPQQRPRVSGNQR
ncbi:MAG: hypothetical protein AB7O26_10220 [Planctomycetaceae bacterium]